MFRNHFLHRRSSTAAPPNLEKNEINQETSSFKEKKKKKKTSNAFYLRLPSLLPHAFLKILGEKEEEENKQ